MNASKKSDERIDDLRRRHRESRREIRLRLAEFAAVPPSEYFYELLYCLLTPQSRAKNAETVISLLRALGFNHQEVDPEPILRSSAHYIRFHRTKTHHLLRVKEQFDVVALAIERERRATHLRDWLVANVKGLGMKESTHFLRNIGRSDGLAILDRHILRNLVRFGMIGRVPDSLTKKQYLRIEKRWMKFSEEIEIPQDELDLLFWSMETGEIRK
jgi:N-glycosylase/DNA lyase